MELHSPGPAGLRKARDSGIQLLASDSANSAFGTRGGGPEPWERQESWFPACQGRLRRRASSGETLPCLSAAFVVYFHLSEPRKITTGMRGTVWKCFLQRPQFTPGGLSKTLITRPRNRQPPSSFCSCGEPRPARWVHLEPLRLGARLAPGKRPSGEDSPGWILKAKQTAS